MLRAVLLPGCQVGIMGASLRQHLWAQSPRPREFTKPLRWEESCCTRPPSTSLPSCWVCMSMTGEAHTLAPSLELGAPCSRLAAPAPQPACCLLPILLPPSLGREAKLPAASKAYCSAVTRSGCRSPGPRKGSRRHDSNLHDLP
ncbi:hypothetical protein R6Z07F_004066 [Ovis aries]|uniref:Uncharacterized protein n=1 Tax=Ovis aries TaxID=9940 RepID=A0A836AK40_SHEEP|nr:hypothetical protein JEQ12_013810 [Ovis aries]